MKSNLISARLDVAYMSMVEKLRAPGETDSQFVRRAIDALALIDVDFIELLESEEELHESQHDKYIYD